MFGYDELKRITAAPERYPDIERLNSWWAERGVDHEGLERFCIEDAEDSVKNGMPMLSDEKLSPYGQAVIAAGYAMSTEVGFILGWLAHEQLLA